MHGAWRPRTGLLAVALVLAVIGFGVLIYLVTTPDPGVAAGASPQPPTASAAAASGSPLASSPGAPQPAAAEPQRAPEGDADPTRDLKSYVSRGEKPTMPEVIERLHERGIYSGLGAFSPPGTRPPMVGLAVPEDFVLPEGYVRHHQATDDGQRIEAILMFAPDFKLYDAAHNPIPMPKNRVVPPELAPPGLPIRRIVIPPPIEPAAPGR
ncbi:MULTISPECIES: hypothetical protein [unclassified Duganella]|uniref:hypothetical protein n=1 Tax=unclassified Duganella TaxID=2636909 RepID=UPI000E3446A8|nr:MULTISPECIES: hypothetical protein [unclassified Duganella]RFP12672.1 hypothetical protein D0T23_16350 [Duganella sp. BJB475]RFP28648.1 hypothetical protein D0T21_20160 [Duganella sp. BJB476]